MKQYSSLKQWPAEKIPFDLSGNIMNRICISGALTRGYELCHGDGVDYTFLSRITDNRFKSSLF